MADANWQRVREVFDAAVQQKPEERQDYINGACGDNRDLQTEVESLFSSLARSDNFLETPAVASIADIIESNAKRFVTGTLFGHYEIIRQIGAGGMGEVFLARDLKLDRSIAIKTLNEEFSRDESSLKRFVREAKAASALNHPNILVIHEIGESEDTHYIVSEFIEGRTLREMRTQSPMSFGEVLNVSTQIADALSAAHEANLIHRDIKPENVMVRPDGYVKVLDFGLAKLMEQKGKSALGLEESTSRQGQTGKGVILGTVNYMSPEQAKGEELDEQTDIFSLGAVIYETIAGRTPFAGNSMSETFANLINAESSPLSRFASNVPLEFQRIVSKSLQKNKAERYRTMRDLLADLKELREKLSWEQKLERSHLPDNNATEVMTATTRDPNQQTAETEHGFSRRIKQHKQGVLIAAAAVVVALATVAYFYFNRNHSAIASGEAIDSVAVLPFVNDNNDPTTEYLSEGISDSIINSLSRLPTLKVQSLTSVLRYKGKQPDPQAVGRELNVRAVLISRITQRGESLSISAELVDARDNSRLWGRQYDRKTSDVLFVPNEIASEMATSLRLRLTGDEKRQLAKPYTQSTEAYQLYSLGNYSFRKNTKEAFEKSINYFKQAVEVDPNYALAYVGLARVYHWMGTRGFAAPEAYDQNVEWSALKALSLDDTVAEAHVYLGVHKFSNFDWVGAEKEIKRALELDPNSSPALIAYSIILRNINGAEAALPYAIRANELNPTEPGELAFAYFLARKYDKAIELYQQRLEKKPDNAAHLHILIGEAYVAKGMHAEGLAETLKGMDLDAVNVAKTPERWERYPMLAHAYAAAGKRSDALKILEDQKRLAEQRYVDPYNFAIMYTSLGDKDRAFEALTRCVQQHTRIIFHLKSRPLFDPLRSDPRYADILRRMNLEP